MFQDWLRRNRRIIFWTTLILIIIPFVFAELFMSAPRGVPSELEEITGPVAVVGDVPISREMFQRRLYQVVEQQAQWGEPPSFEELARTGVADRILEDLIDQTVLQVEAERSGFTFHREYLAELLRQDPTFQDEHGRFDVQRWNEVVQQPGVPWDALYAEVQEQARMSMAAQRAMASARVLESEIREEFEKAHTQLEVRHATVEPPVDLDDEELQAYYEDNLDRYQRPPQRRAEYAAISLRPERPDLVDELVERARDDEDFAELAREYSDGPAAEEGGDLGWIRIDDGLPPHREILEHLEVGEVSDPVERTNAYTIYRVEEEREDEETGALERRVRAIEIVAELSEEERAERRAQAEELLEAAREASELEIAAEEAGVEVETTELFSRESTMIEPAPAEDATVLRSRLDAVTEGEFADVISTPRNYYVARVIEVTEPEQRPFDEVADEVRADLEQEKRASEEYLEDAMELALEIAQAVDSLDQIAEEYPDVEVEFGETQPFTVDDYDYADGVLWNPREVYRAVADLEPGVMAGPITDFMGNLYFVELIERTPPTEEQWAEVYPEEREEIRERLLMARRQEVLEDYVLDLKMRPADGIPIMRNHLVLAHVLGLTDEEGELTEAGQELMETVDAPPAVEHEPGELGAPVADHG